MIQQPISLAARLQELPRAFSVSTWIAGVLAVIVGFTGSLVLTFDVAQKAHLSSAQLSSWVWSITVGSGLLSFGLSLWYRQPVLTAWSTPGLAVLASSLSQYKLEEAVGAYIVVGLMIAILGATGLFDRVMRLVPQNVALAVLAGILFKYGLELFSSITLEPVMILVMLAVFLIAKKTSSRVPMAWALVSGFVTAALLGKFNLDGVKLELAVPMLVAPAFSIPPLIGLGFPLLVLSLASQNAPGLAVMRANGYEPPTRGALMSTGLLSAVFAPMLCHGLTLAAITAAIANGTEAHSDPKLRYGAGLTAGILKATLGLFGATIVAVFLAVPHALIAAMAGLALSGTIQSCLTGAFSDSRHRDSSIFALLVTASGVTLLGLGSAFWGLLFGSLVGLLLESDKT